MISVIGGSHAARDARPGAQGGGCVMIPWAEMRVVRERKGRKCILVVFM